jgi:hypothetical protein
LLTRAADLLDNATDTLRGKQTNSTVLDYIGWAEGNATAAEQHYQTMDYIGAVPDARTAQENAIIAAKMAQQLPTLTPPPDNTSEVSFYRGLVVGLLGMTLFLVLVIYAVAKRKKGRAGKA